MTAFQNFLQSPKVDSIVQIAMAISAFFLPDNIEHVIAAGMGLLGVKNSLVLKSA